MPSKNAKTVAKAAGKPSASKAPAKTAAKAPVTKPAAKPVAAAAPKAAVKPAVPPRVEEKKPLTQRQGFKTNEFVVYPAHGVGQILAIEEQEIAGAKLELFVINFIKDKMTLRVPTAKVANVGMRKLSDPSLVKRALETLKEVHKNKDLTGIEAALQTLNTAWEAASKDLYNASQQAGAEGVQGALPPRHGA